ncbi:glycoside hydrolase family 2 protein [Microbacter margulisiae]|uniref:beta-galactosidase n=1 Tax=Microbacter margulisiae TaxID=1350067 RepID=A0A7W5DQR8_9PORP|nr:glycoside hydrolase family 2 TIM barrel-domain containing protein [Microbacter margulisiae]MBB3187020.1 hypothetical protein [Microbacter margulisiae]
MSKQSLLSLFFISVFLLNIVHVHARKHETALPASSTSTEIQYLSGHGPEDAVSWDFFCTKGRNSGKWTTIKVPSCWELQGFGTYQYGLPFYGKANPPGIANEQGLYKYKFKVPANWEGRIIRIVFEGVMTDCSVKINGRKCIKLHQGGFYRFKSQDISGLLSFGNKENLLEVTVSKESSDPNVNLAERRADYWNFGGIFRPVFLESMPAQYIDRTAINALANGHFSADVYFGYALNSDFNVRAQLTDVQGHDIGHYVDVPVRGGADHVQIDTCYSNIKTWTPETPNLYYIKLSLMQGDTVRHVVKVRFGFRTIEVRPHDGLYINGQKVLVKGICRHSFRPATGRTLSRKDNYDDVKLIKEMNMNAVRLSHYPSDPAFLDACDELGLYVMVELGGWHGKYDTTVGRKLVREMVTRDENHPCVTWWSNGNEGGWNTELDGEFKQLDPQQRPVIHPSGDFDGFETMHYRSYGQTEAYLRKPDIFMPTEFLHGLYDGGLGAGLSDYWKIMRKAPRCAGGFLWGFTDQGVVRTDENGRIDCVGSYAPDGILGPHHEKEGSFFTVKQIWSPVQIENKTLPKDFNGVFTVDNWYDFTNLKNCTFTWKLAKLPFMQPKEIIASGQIESPNVAPHGSGFLKANLPANWRDADVLYLTATDPFGKELWTWSWTWKKSTDFYSFGGKSGSTLNAKEDSTTLVVTTDSDQLTFSRSTGELMHVVHNGKLLSFGNGPRFTAALRGDRSLDGYFNTDDKDAIAKDRIYYDISDTSQLTQLTYKTYPDSIVVNAVYFGELKQAHWVIFRDGNIRLDYQYKYDGVVELMGIKFDFPENKVLSKQWLGNGPYRVWQNRILGTTFSDWKCKYNDPIPGESFVYPEFKGFFYNWKWITFNTKEGDFSIGNDDPNSYIGVYTPKDGRDAQLYTFPKTGISILKVIPAVRNKVNGTDLIGPSSQPKWVHGIQKGSLYFKF